MEPGPGRETELRALIRTGELQARLDAALGKRKVDWVAVALSYRGQEATAHAGRYRPRRGDAVPGPWMRAGCIAKLFTAELISLLQRSDRLALDDDITQWLQQRWASAVAPLGGITIRNLMEHTHGLDDSRIERAPRSANGRIDVGQLCAQLASAPRLAPPGAAYSYGSAGPWLLAALLESAHEARFAEVLYGKILEPRGLADRRGGTGRGASVCPSTGGNLVVSMPALLSFLIDAAETHGSAGVDAGMVHLPGWSAQEYGIRRGWKDYGSGWIGHNSALPAAAGMVRVLPQERLAIALTCSGAALANVFARVFGAIAPELAALRLPRPLASAERERLPLETFVGRYGNSAMCVHVARQERGGLQLAVRRRGDDLEQEPFLTLALHPAHDNVFFTTPIHAQLFPFVQFVMATEQGRRFIWNGRTLWPALEPAGART